MGTDISLPRPVFQSTLPTRGSDAIVNKLFFFKRVISIHAPHEGERHKVSAFFVGIWEFQSTLPTRGSDANVTVLVHGFVQFQSTLPTRGSDCVYAAKCI